MVFKRNMAVSTNTALFNQNCIFSKNWLPLKKHHILLKNVHCFKECYIPLNEIVVNHKCFYVRKRPSRKVPPRCFRCEGALERNPASLQGYIQWCLKWVHSHFCRLHSGNGKNDRLGRRLYMFKKVLHCPNENCLFNSSTALLQRNAKKYLEGT